MRAISRDVYAAIRDIAAAQRLLDERRDRMLRLAQYAADREPQEGAAVCTHRAGQRTRLHYRWGGRRNGGGI